ncbi:diguanylate cyclase (GGDEF) domain-containing protein [Cryptosporangium arvum DSM 44712]|uniref:Diguanylate cyclase (GGDEF) domain-containing protein n=1 Tax=Cryptosporangium arvum DSM 44712 TaxID=927661 RepID=A0A010ZU32_9ACTN|nr:diguanylate cyclase (GGDEF) domain-containing protein [Cryptosporangium arvum DSM 44712]
MGGFVSVPDVIGDRSTGSRASEGAPRIPGLVLLGEIGRGNDTVVYRARRDGPDVESIQQYAVKVLGLAASVGDEARHKFRREAAVLACVDHPGVVRVHAVGEVDGRPYLVMELVEGRSLAEVLHGGQLDQASAAVLGAAVADALAAAHRVGLVHRDVKPHNIMVRSDGRPMLIDFGLIDFGPAAAGGDAPGLGIRPSGAIAGTLTYTSPEQCGLLHRPVDGRSDLYSLGVVLYECVTGRPPFLAPDIGELMHLHATTAPPDPRMFRTDLSGGFVSVLGRLLAKDPDDRYPGALAVADDLRRLLPDAAPPSAGVVPSGIDARSPLPLVGRERELAALLGYWRRTAAGTASLVVLEGAPGIGKSRLAEQLVVEVRARASGRPGPVILTARATDGAAPLAGLRTAIDQYVRTVERLPDGARAEAHHWLTTAAAPVATLLQPLSPALAGMLGLPAPVADDSGQHQFPAAVATFLSELARCAGGLLIRVEDAHVLDSASARVLAQILAERAGNPVMVLATSRGVANATSLIASAEMQTLVDERILLGPLHPTAVAELVERLSGRMDLGREFAERIATATDGNPLAVLQYFRAAVEGGLIRPSWGRWIVDLDGLASVRLPTDVVAFLIGRLEQLSAPVRAILVVAAALGVRFDPGMLSAVSGASAEDVRVTLDEAGRLRVVERRGGGDYGFVHSGIRRALLRGGDRMYLRAVHQAAAELLTPRDFTGPVDPGRIYAVARHRMNGQVERNPGAVVQACADAARQALADYSPIDAVGYADEAERVATTYRLPLPYRFDELIGLALHQSGRYAEALDRLGSAIDRADDPLDRGRLLVDVGQVHLSRWDPTAADHAFSWALSVLGHPLPRNRTSLALSSGLSALVAVTRMRGGRTTGTTTGPERERNRLVAKALVGLAHSAQFGMRPRQVPTYALRALLPVARIGPTPEYVGVFGLLGMASAATGRRRIARRLFARAHQAADALGQPQLTAQTALQEQDARYLIGDNAPDRAAALLGERGQWLDLFLYLNGTAVFCWQRLVRGDVVTALAAYRGGAQRLTLSDEDDPAFALVGAAVTAACGRLTDAHEQLAQLRELVAAREGDVSGLRVNTAMTETQVAVESGDLGERFDATLDWFARMGLEPGALLPIQRTVYVYQAYGRLEQCRRDRHRRRAEGGEAQGVGMRDEKLDAARRAVADLAAAARGRSLQAHALVAKAELIRLEGNPAGALEAALAAAGPIRTASSALAEYEAARVRARALLALGDPGAARRAARDAIDLATEHGWPHRSDWVRLEFELVGESPVGTYDPDWDISRSAADRERLAALEQVSKAAAGELDLLGLARVGLDESIKILRAERGLLFLMDDETGRLELWLGRNARKEDLIQPGGYATTLVDRVRMTRHELVITGPEDGAALGSGSVLEYGLRSVVVAPLELDGHLLGVVYLDSRVATGVFRPKDAAILTAICTHVAAALETARAAEFAAGVRAVQQEQKTADLLRIAMTSVSGTLDPAMVLMRIHNALRAMLPGDVSWLVERDADGTLRLSGEAGFEQVKPETLKLLLTVDSPLVVPIDGPSSLLVVPLTIAENPPARIGVVLLAADGEDAFRDSHLGLAEALATHGMTAYQNALLFQEVTRLATLDGLTGVANRRHFYEEAGAIVEAGGPTAAIMVDIDHFKQVNDGHGHGVGDQVIAEVAARLKRVLDSGGWLGTGLAESGPAGTAAALGRYGGEEFAVVLGGAAAERAARVASGLHAAVREQPVETDTGPLPITVSVGVYSAAGTDLSALLGSADEALYAAKRGGRDRVVVGNRTLPADAQDSA